MSDSKSLDVMPGSPRSLATDPPSEICSSDEVSVSASQSPEQHDGPATKRRRLHPPGLNGLSQPSPALINDGAGATNTPQLSISLSTVNLSQLDHLEPHTHPTNSFEPDRGEILTLILSGHATRAETFEAQVADAMDPTSGVIESSAVIARDGLSFDGWREKVVTWPLIAKSYKSVAYAPQD